MHPDEIDKSFIETTFCRFGSIARIVGVHEYKCTYIWLYLNG